MRARPRRWWSLVLAAALIAGCGGSPPDLGSVEFQNPETNQPATWKLIEVEGIVPGIGRFDPLAFQIDPDGRSMTVYFQGGNPECYALAGVPVVRNDPDPPDVQVEYGLRLGVMGCDAALYNLATRVRLDPPFQDG